MKAITANRLQDGRVVYLDAAGRWTVRLADARLLPQADAEAALAAARGRKTEIAGAYLIDVTEAGPAGREALRELIRRDGPTVQRSLNSLHNPNIGARNE